MNIRRVKFRDLEQVPYMRVRENFSQGFQGSAPAPFVGRFGYPKVNVGILSPQFLGEMQKYDSPRMWNADDTPIGVVASRRYELVNSRVRSEVQQVRSYYASSKLSPGSPSKSAEAGKAGKVLEVAREIALARKAVDVEILLRKKPALSAHPEKEIIPFGPQGEIAKVQLASNPSADSRLEKAAYDTDLKAVAALGNLYRQGFEENTLSKMLSVGSLGIGRNRRLVPTRWSITATDDTLGRELIRQVKDFPPGDFQCFFGGGWGNYYLVLFFPQVWGYELFETYLSPVFGPHRGSAAVAAESQDGSKNIKGTYGANGQVATSTSVPTAGTAALANAALANPWSRRGYAYSTDYENYEGRKDYAEETAGGYYAARLPVAERMKELKRQHAALVLRFITSEYKVPLGVWVCREAARRSLAEKPLYFASQELLLQYARELILKKFGLKIDFLLRESRLLQEKKVQRRLEDF